MSHLSCYALIDCNNFYAACERVFDPSLAKKPVAILSNNDGCIIARSNEVKALNVPMGAPIHEYLSVLLHHDVTLLSANFALYGDMSQRVVATIRSFGLPVEIYSVDELFMRCSPSLNAKEIQERVLQWTGIPVAIGVAQTKTLAKLANSYAKKHNSTCFLLEEEQIDLLLGQTPVEKIWGIGRKKAEKLHSFHIHTALQLKNVDLAFIRKHFSVITLKTCMELRNTPCLQLEEYAAPKKSMTSSRSFGKPVLLLQELKEAIATFTAKLGIKLRQERSVGRLLIVFTSHSSAHFLLPVHTNDTRLLLEASHSLTEQLYSPGTVYKKGGVILSDICSEETYQQDFFTQEKKSDLMKVLDTVNTRFGKRSVFFAAEGTEKKWASKQEKVSPRYTTRWDELPKIN